MSSTGKNIGKPKSTRLRGSYAVTGRLGYYRSRQKADSS